MKNALVLSGGSVKGCFQVGAIKAIIENGFIPDIIYGISVGSLNGTYITYRAGQLFRDGGNKPLGINDWKKIADDLIHFWTTEITGPSDVAIQRSLWKVGWHALNHNFQGLSDTWPVHEKIDGLLKDMSILKNAPVKLKVGTVDFVTSELLYKSPGDADFIDYLKGSMAIPIAMPPSYHKNEILFDGGAREVAPIGTAINDKMENIIAVLCHAKSLGSNNNFNDRELMELVDRVQSIVVNENVRNDSEWVTFLNELLIQTKGMDIPLLNSYKLIEHTVIQPDKALTIDITDFDSKDIKDLIKEGYETAINHLRKPELTSLLDKSAGAINV